MSLLFFKQTNQFKTESLSVWLVTDNHHLYVVSFSSSHMGYGTYVKSKTLKIIYLPDSIRFYCGWCTFIKTHSDKCCKYHHTDQTLFFVYLCNTEEYQHELHNYILHKKIKRKNIVLSIISIYSSCYTTGLFHISATHFFSNDVTLSGLKHLSNNAKQIGLYS